MSDVIARGMAKKAMDQTEDLRIKQEQSASEIDDAKGTFATLEEKLNSMVVDGGLGSEIILRDVLANETFTISNATPTPIYGNIVVSKTAQTLNEGTTTTFTVSLDKAPTNNQIVTISLNNADITVDKNSLTFTPSNYATAQTVTVTVAEDQDTSDDSCTITLSSSNVANKALVLTIIDVTTPPTNPIAVTGVTLDKTAHSFKTNEILQLNATVTPSNATNKSLSWVSSNNNIATVSGSGLVRAIAEGSATITATTADGSFTAQCVLTITKSEDGFDGKQNAYVQDQYMYLNPETILDSDITLRTGEASHIYFSFSTLLQRINKSLSTATATNASNVFNGVIPFAGEHVLNDFTSGNINCPDTCYIINQNTIYVRIPSSIYANNSNKIPLALASISKRLPILNAIANEEIIITDSIIDSIASLSSITITNNMHTGFANLPSSLNAYTSLVDGVNSISGRYLNTITNREVWFVNATTRLNFKIPQEKMAICDLANIKQYLKNNRLTFWIAK